MSQQNVNTAAHESSETIYLTTKNIAYRHVRDNIFQHVETGMTYTASSEGRLFNPVDFSEVTIDGQLIVKSEENKGHIKIGQIVGTANFGNGVVCGISGQQGKTPITKQFGGALVSGGSASFDVVFYDGSRNRAVPEAILCSGLPWYITNEIASQDEINKLIALSEETVKKDKEKHEKETSEFNDAVENFKVSEKYKHLIQGNDKYSGKLAAKNIRIELKKAFKGVKFSVRMSHFGTLNIRWTDGPKIEEVEDITMKYKVGRFNYYEDYSYSEVGSFNVVYGGTDYLFTSRDFSDEFIEEAIGVLLDKYESYFKDKARPTVEDYRKGRLYEMGREYFPRNMQYELSQLMGEL